MYVEFSRSGALKTFQLLQNLQEDCVAAASRLKRAPLIHCCSNKLRAETNVPVVIYHNLSGLRGFTLLASAVNPIA